MRYLLWTPDQGFGGKFVLTPRTTDEMVSYKAGPNVVPGRTYTYAIAPKNLSVTIWTWNQRGERLRSDRFIPSAGLSHRERYDACCEMIKNVGLVPPPYQP